MNTTLFLGFPLDDGYIVQMQKNKPEYLELFIRSGSDYLQKVEFDKVSYLGKFVQNEEPLAQLELLEANIYSLLKKLVADYSYQNTPLILFAIRLSYSCTLPKTY
jgi:hypothetical protein